uniref:Uncharacterized protein n=1 Tax=Rhizophora mucronata TaxID=61149 RepID=A0A2P2N109_RHIMU
MGLMKADILVNEFTVTGFCGNCGSWCNSLFTYEACH